MPLKPSYQCVKVEKENGITWAILKLYLFR